MRYFAKKLGCVPFLLQGIGVIRGANNVDLVGDYLPLLSFALRSHQLAAYYYRGAGGEPLDRSVIRQAVPRDDLQTAKRRAVVQFDKREILRIPPGTNPPLDLNPRQRPGCVERFFYGDGPYCVSHAAILALKPTPQGRGYRASVIGLDISKVRGLYLSVEILHTKPEAIYFLQICVSLFLAILFLQSGVDKIVDRRGNLEWLTGHFAKSPLAGLVPLLLLTITGLELAAGILSSLGVVQLLLKRETSLAFYGACVALIAILCLFLGQRLAKDYPGAATLVPYFLLAIAATFLLA